MEAAIVANTETLYQIADELRSIASQGLLYAENNFVKGRYTRIMAASARLIGTIEHRPSEEILRHFQDNLFHLSPVV